MFLCDEVFYPIVVKYTRCEVWEQLESYMFFTQFSRLISPFVFKNRWFVKKDTAPFDKPSSHQ